MKKTIVALLLGCSAFAAPNTAYHLLKKIPVTGEGNWDYLAIDQTARRLYASHGPQVEVIDLDTDAPVGKIEGMNGTHGIAIAPELGRGFITSGNTASVKMFDLKTLKSLADIPAADGADGILYEPTTQRIFSFNHRAKSFTVIDAKEAKPIKTIPLAGQPEFPVTDNQGNIWVNLEDVSTLIRIDPKEMTIVDQWPVAPCEAPASMDMDRKNRRLFIGCNNLKMAVADADSGKIITTLPIGEHVDATAYDPSTRLIFNANRATVTIIHQDSSDSYSVVQTLDTLPRANTLALDQKTKKLYLSTAEFESKPAETPGGKAKQVMKPGTFTILVYGIELSTALECWRPSRSVLRLLP